MSRVFENGDIVWWLETGANPKPEFKDLMVVSGKVIKSNKLNLLLNDLSFPYAGALMIASKYVYRTFEKASEALNKRLEDIANELPERL